MATVTSTMMKKTGKIDNGAYQKFISKTFKQLKKMNLKDDFDIPFTDEKLMEQAEMMCGMYKHNFAEFKDVAYL
mgnify:CR=1 FL=1